MGQREHLVLLLANMDARKKNLEDYTEEAYGFRIPKDFDRRYMIRKLLRHGQFGYTYVATDKANGDRVAVKKIEKTKMILPIAVEIVKREVKILQALAGHENIVHFYNAF